MKNYVQRIYNAVLIMVFPSILVAGLSLSGAAHAAEVTITKDNVQQLLGG